MATQFSDMALGGESGFAAGYTPIRFAPLVSLTGPITAPVPPAAPEAPVAPMIRLPVYQGDAGDYGGMPHKYAGGPPVGERSREALKADLANAVGFFVNPFGTLANYVLTGQTPAMQFGVGNQREALGLQQSDTMWEGVLPKGGIRDAMTRARNLLFGEQQPSVPLGDMRSVAGVGNQGLASAVFNDALSFASNAGVSDAFANQAGATALSLFSQGIDPATAVAMAVQAAQMDMATLPDMTQGAPTPGLAAMNQTLAQFAQGGPAAVAPGAYAVGMGPTESSYDFSSSGYGGGTAGETGAPGESSYGLDR